MKNNLVNINFIEYQEKYVQYIKKQELDLELKNDFIEILNEKDLNKKMDLWKKIKVSIDQIKNLNKLANPFYIGFGNPEAEILFIGKEKAFNITNAPESFLIESVNNLAQWEMISNKNENLKFNPINPVIYYKEEYNHKIKGRETWGMYKTLIEKISNSSQLKDEELFANCFTTEINHIPSKTTSNKRLIDDRIKFLQKESFFKSFKYVIIGAKGSVSIEEIKNIFGNNPIERNVNIGNNNRTSFDIDILVYTNQKVILCNQLSGATGWTSNAIDNLIKNINAE